MLDLLLNAKNLTDIENIASAILIDGCDALEEDMRKDRVIFNRVDYWTASEIKRHSKSNRSVTATLGAMVSEERNERLLHILQLVAATEPGVADDIDKLLARSSL